MSLSRFSRETETAKTERVRRDTCVCVRVCMCVCVLFGHAAWLVRSSFPYRGLVCVGCHLWGCTELDTTEAT